MILLKSLAFSPVILLIMFVCLLSDNALATVSSFTGTSTQAAAGTDKTFEITIPPPAVVGTLTLSATGAVQVTDAAGGVTYPTYTVANNPSSSPTVTLNQSLPRGSTMVVTGSTSGGNGGDYTAAVGW